MGRLRSSTGPMEWMWSSSNRRADPVWCGQVITTTVYSITRRTVALVLVLVNYLILPARSVDRCVYMPVFSSRRNTFLECITAQRGLTAGHPRRVVSYSTFPKTPETPMGVRAVLNYTGMPTQANTATKRIAPLQGRPCNRLLYV